MRTVLSRMESAVTGPGRCVDKCLARGSRTRPDTGNTKLAGGLKLPARFGLESLSIVTQNYVGDSERTLRAVSPAAPRCYFYSVKCSFACLGELTFYCAGTGSDPPLTALKQTPMVRLAGGDFI